MMKRRLFGVWKPPRSLRLYVLICSTPWVRCAVDVLVGDVHDEMEPMSDWCVLPLGTAISNAVPRQGKRTH